MEHPQKITKLTDQPDPLGRQTRAWRRPPKAQTDQADFQMALAQIRQSQTDSEDLIKRQIQDLQAAILQQAEQFANMQASTQSTLGTIRDEVADMQRNSATQITQLTSLVSQIAQATQAKANASAS